MLKESAAAPYDDLVDRMATVETKLSVTVTFFELAIESFKTLDKAFRRSRPS